jgi:hypothetical protein
MNWIKRAVLTTLCCAAASAGPITFTETQLGIGSLGGTSFNNALVTLVLTTDTSTITGSGIFYDIGPATVTVAGIGTATFTDTMEVFSNQGNHAAGIEDAQPGMGDVLDVFNTAFGTYALNTAIGPLPGNPEGSPGQSFPTSLGAFILTSSANGDHPAMFAATTVGSVPEPATLGLLTAGIALFLIRRRVAG